MAEAVRKPFRRWLAGSALALLGGCSMAPAYHPPVIAAPPAYKEAAPADGVWQPVGAARPRSDWWTAFGDPTLDTLEARIDGGNPTLAGALARYDVARAYLAGAKAGLLPHVGL
ncbi:MAG TPA: RND transporter, partial [Sphingomonas sanguinis]|nr:RND transporter [Sphingomonas sanguinis]